MVFSISGLMCIYSAFYIVLAERERTFYSIRSCLTLVKAITPGLASEKSIFCGVEQLKHASGVLSSPSGAPNLQTSV